MRRVTPAGDAQFCQPAIVLRAATLAAIFGVLNEIYDGSTEAATEGDRNMTRDGYLGGIGRRKAGIEAGDS